MAGGRAQALSRQIEGLKERAPQGLVSGRAGAYRRSAVLPGGQRRAIKGRRSVHPRARGESSQRETSPPTHPKHTHTQKTPHVRLAQEKKGRELVCTSSRKLLRRSPVKVAVSVVHRAGLRLPGGAGPWVGRVLGGAPRRQSVASHAAAGARAALGLLALIPSRKLLHRSPVKVAVPATNRAGALALRVPAVAAVVVHQRGALAQDGVAVAAAPLPATQALEVLARALSHARARHKLSPWGGARASAARRP